jgi:hypothetical protein
MSEYEIIMYLFIYYYYQIISWALVAQPRRLAATPWLSPVYVISLPFLHLCDVVCISVQRIRSRVCASRWATPASLSRAPWRLGAWPDVSQAAVALTGKKHGFGSVATNDNFMAAAVMRLRTMSKERWFRFGRYCVVLCYRSHVVVAIFIGDHIIGVPSRHQLFSITNTRCEWKFLSRTRSGERTSEGRRMKAHFAMDESSKWLTNPQKS